jgi:hypothetical protein
MLRPVEEGVIYEFRFPGLSLNSTLFSNCFQVQLNYAYAYANHHAIYLSYLFLTKRKGCPLYKAYI